jgi:preprotein translocase subunit SecF
MGMLLLYVKRYNFIGLPDALVITCIHFLTIGRNLLLISIYIAFAFSKIAALSAVCLMDADSVTKPKYI